MVALHLFTAPRFFTAPKCLTAVHSQHLMVAADGMLFPPHMRRCPLPHVETDSGRLRPWDGKSTFPWPRRSFQNTNSPICTSHCPDKGALSALSNRLCTLRD